MFWTFPTCPYVTSATVITLAGDVTGPSNANTVVKLQGRAVSSSAPATGDDLVWNGFAWAPGIGSASSGSVLTGQTLWGSPAVGEVGYVSGNATLAKARANAAATSTKVVGAYQGTAGTVTVAGSAYLLFDAGLTLTAGDPVYLSVATAGRVTNMDPSVLATAGSTSVLLGTLDTAAGYNSGTGSALMCKLDQFLIGGPF